MTGTMKGLLKGLRYISQIFENSDEDEPEMQIGNPTDVKHVAHIGCDGPSASSPSWINDFKAPSESASAPLSFPQKNETLLTRRHPEDVFNKPLEIPPRRFPSLDDPSPDAPPEDRRQSRRTRSAGGSINSPGRDIPNGHKPRKHQHNSSLGLDPTSNGAPSPPSIPKKTRKKKPKDKESSVNGDGVTDGSSKPGGGPGIDGSLKSGGGLVNGSTKTRTRGHRNSESKSKDNDRTTSALTGLKLNEGIDSYEGIPRQDLDL